MKKVLLFLPFCFVLLSNAALCQILYNKATPASYDAAGLTPLNKIPVMHYTVDDDGNFTGKMMNVNVKDNALIEKKGGKYIARIMFKVHAEKLGEISLLFKDVKLRNDAYCYVYTNDYQIVAGPIYQKSIIKDLNIMQLPAAELVLEVVCNNKEDFDLTLDEITYRAMFKSSKKKVSGDRLLGDYDSCYSCSTYGTVSHSDKYLDCIWLGSGDNDELFNLHKLSSVNDFDYDASRASCVIMTPHCNDSIKYQGENGTLMNFPYKDCNDPSECGQGFVFTVHHIGQIQEIVNAYNANDQDYLGNVLIRFNWHYKYGKPWDLNGMTCDGTVPVNFALWRSKIDFSEVIDYCGVDVFAYSVLAASDIVILKMRQKPFYKELHLGWTTQANFDSYDLSGSDDYARSHKIDDYKILGRRTHKPTMIFDNYYVEFNPYFYNTPYNGEITLEVTYYPGGDIIMPSDMLGYSGAQLTFRDYIDTNQIIGLGLVRTQSGSSFLGYQLGSRSYYTYFYNSNSIVFTESCYSSYNNINNYFAGEFSGIPYPHAFTHHYVNSTSGINTVYQDTCTWYPSTNNKQLCSSRIGFDTTSHEFTDSCDFDIAGYVHSSATDTTLCITIDSIPPGLFPDSTYPMGYRVYHNFGDQKTVDFDEFNDNAAISFPITFCLTKCDLLYLMAIGRDSLDLAIDFYDSTGRELNNPGCDSLDFKLAFPEILCETFTFSVSKVDSSDSCCTYKIGIKVNDCASNVRVLKEIGNAMTFKSFDMSSPELVSLQSGYSIDYAGDSIKFTYQVCNARTDTASSFQFYFANKKLACYSAPVNFSQCKCSCPSQEAKASWFDITITGGDSSTCGDDYCSVSAKINVPSYYNCYHFYKVNTNFFKFPITPDGSISQYNSSPLNCIHKGSMRMDTLRLYKDPADNDPCIIINPVFCPLEDSVHACTPDCDTINWNYDSVSVVLPGCPSCTVYGKFAWRNNTCFDSAKQDIQVISFETRDSAACAGCVPSSDYLYKLVLKKAIYDNNMGFLPVTATDSCNDTWRVVQASCWIEYYDNITNPNGTKRYRPCDSTDCCSIGLRVCRFAGPPAYITIDTLGSSSSTDTCSLHTQQVIDYNNFGAPIILPDGSVTYITYKTDTCQSRCSFLYSLADSAYYGKRAKPEQYDIESTDYHGLDEIDLKIKIHEDYLNFYIVSDIESDDMKISVTSLKGETLATDAFRLKKGENEYQIRTDNLRTGIYFISVQVNGLMLKTEKFIIVR